jgi:hypothetical protein
VVYPAVLVLSVRIAEVGNICLDVEVRHQDIAKYVHKYVQLDRQQVDVGACLLVLVLNVR